MLYLVVLLNVFPDDIIECHIKINETCDAFCCLDGMEEVKICK